MWFLFFECSFLLVLYMHFSAYVREYNFFSRMLNRCNYVHFIILISLNFYRNFGCRKALISQFNFWKFIYIWKQLLFHPISFLQRILSFRLNSRSKLFKCNCFEVIERFLLASRVLFFWKKEFSVWSRSLCWWLNRQRGVKIGSVFAGTFWMAHFFKWMQGKTFRRNFLTLHFILIPLNVVTKHVKIRSNYSTRMYSHIHTKCATFCTWIVDAFFL